MPKYIKYLENGTYKYATVKDVGDLLQLKTSTKKDIVSAINELIAGGISGGGSGGDGLTTEDIINIINGSDAVTDINSQIAQMAADIKANKDEFDKDVTETQKELNDRMDKVQTDIQKVIDDYQTAQDAKNEEQAENITNLNNENTQIKNDLAGAKEDLENVQGDLSNFDHDMTEVKQSVNDVKGELDSKVSSTELDATNGRIDKTETDIAQNKKDIELKASQDSLDLLKGDVSKNTAALKVANDAIEGKVSREDLVNEVEDFTVKKANLFTGTREWQGWEESNSAEVIITDQKDNFGTATEFLNVSDYISLTVDNLKVGETYTISVSARSDKDTDGTVAQVFDIGEFQTTDTKDTFVRTTLQRYYVNFVATDESMTFKLGAKSLANQAHLFLSKAKLETGAKATMWEDNANDSYARIEKNDADVKVLADRVISTVSKQKETDDKVTQNTTDIAQTAEKVETNIKALQSQDGRITENKAQITATANGLRTEFTQKTNDAIGAITDGGKNLILSSAFQTDPAMKNWQSVNNKVVVKEKNSQNWAYMNQSGLSTDNPIGLTSNYFAMKANDPLVIAFDIIIGDVSKLDNKTVLNVSYYDKDDNRVDFKDYTLTDLGIKSPTSGETNRAYIKINTTHDDVVKGAILPRLSRNGEVWMSNFFAKISSISNGDYEVANADLEDMQSTDHFKLEQTAQGLTGKADSSQLNKLSGDLTTLSNNFSTTSAGFNASLSKIDDKVNSNKEETDSALSVAKADIKTTADNLSTNYTKTTDEHNYVNSQIKQSADQINLSVSSVSDKIDANQTDTDSKIAALQIVDDQIKSTVASKVSSSDVQGMLDNGGYATQTWTGSQIDQKADEISSTVTSVSNKVDNLNVNSRNLAVWEKWQIWDDLASQTCISTTTQSIELACDNTNNFQGIWFAVDMKGSSKYVLSFDATLKKGVLQGIGGHTGSFSSAIVYIDGKKTDSVWSNGTNTLYKVGDKHHYEVHFISKNDPNNSANTPGFFLQPNRGNASKNDQVTVLFENIMIQEGDKATGYTPAPEDMATVKALSKVDQKADSISSTVTNNKSDADTKFTNINQTINGIQSTVKNKADSSTVTQLSNQINLKVDTSDYNTAMGNKADKDNLVSQINIDKSGVLISGDKVHITGDTTIDNASIDGAKIKNLDVTKLTGNTANLVKAGFNSINGNIQIGNGQIDIMNGKGGVSLFSGGLHFVDTGNGEDLGHIIPAFYPEHSDFNGIAISMTNINDFFMIGRKSGTNGIIPKLEWQGDALANYFNRVTSWTFNDHLIMTENSGLHNHKALMFSVDTNNNVSVFQQGDSFTIADTDGVPLFYGSAKGGKESTLMGWSDSKHATLLELYNDGTPQVKSKAIYDRALTRSNNTYIGTDGSLCRNTSSQRSKYGISDIANIDTMSDSFINNVHPRQWYDKFEVDRHVDNLNDGGKRTQSSLDLVYGLVAEELEKAGLSEFVEYDENGIVQGVSYDRLVVLLLPKIKQLQDRVNELEHENAIAGLRKD